MKKFIDLIIKNIKDEKLNEFLDAISNIITHTDRFANKIDF